MDTPEVAIVRGLLYIAAPIAGIAIAYELIRRAVADGIAMDRDRLARQDKKQKRP